MDELVEGGDPRSLAWRAGRGRPPLEVVNRRPRIFGAAIVRHEA